MTDTTAIITDEQVADADLEKFLPENDDLLPHILEKGVHRRINVTLKEVVISKEMKKENPLYTYDRGFIVSDRDFGRLAANTTYEHAFNMTRRAAKLLLDNCQLDSVTFKFPNEVRATFNIEEL